MTEPAPDLVAETLGGPQVLDLYEPETAGATTPLCLVLPALGISASYYRPFGAALAARGFRAVVADFPGHGQSPLRAARGSDWSYADLVTLHAPAILAAARARFPQAPRVWIGHSIGGQVALMHAGRVPDAVAAVIVIASGSAHAGAWSGARGQSMKLVPLACSLLTKPLGYFPGHRVGFGGREAKTLIRQWAKAARSGRYAWGDFDGEQALASWSGPTLAIPLAGDVWAPREAMAHTLDKTQAAVAWRPWVEPAPPDHNRWPRKPEPPAEVMTAWLAEHGVQPPASKA